MKYEDKFKKIKVIEKIREEKPKIEKVGKLEKIGGVRGENKKFSKN